MTLLRYIDVVLVIVAAPILLLIGAPPSGYLAGAGAWVALRALGVAIDQFATAGRDASVEITLRLAYLIGRLFALALTVILVRQGAGRDAGLTALGVIVFAFTVALAASFPTRPRRR